MILNSISGLSRNCQCKINCTIKISAKAGIQVEKVGFRIKSGMTKCVKSFLRQYTRLTIHRCTDILLREEFNSLHCPTEGRHCEELK
jgi:hypothetical protein